MNSRGTLISHRISGDTLAIRDRVAMTPTVQPAVAGTQRYREFGRLPERGPERGPEAGEASVTDREDMPSSRENPDEAPGDRGSSWPGLSNGGDARPAPVRPQTCWKTCHGC